MMNHFRNKNFWILMILGAVIYFGGNDIISLTNPDEVFYACTAKEMIEQKSWAVPYLFGQPQFEKPILTYLLIKIGFMLGGISAFTARFFPAVFALLGCLAVFFWTNSIFNDKKKAFFCSLILMTSGMYIGLAKTVFTDMIFSDFVTLSMIFFYEGYRKGI
ncbi:MAG: glycosyltransferase family 39 protein, partial [Candidatus Omnitrophica bacterium]|nr:glycosyltransferase family 39 protein [Candidatus Omnitrophota bacterium]